MTARPWSLYSALLLLTGSCVFGAAELYPATGGKTLNLRVPTYAAPDRGAKGAAIPFEQVRFDYPLAPHLRFDGAGRLEFMLRARRKPFRVEVLELQDPERGALVLQIQSARVGRNQAEFLFRKGNQVLTSAPLPETPGPDWSAAEIVWQGTDATLTLGGKPVAKLAELPPGFAPTRLGLNVWSVDELKLEGANGTFTLDWENRTYAGRLAVREGGGVSAEVMGFDSGAVTLDRASRECPVIQLLNTTDHAVTTEARFRLRSEVAGETREWTQQLAAGPRQDQLHFIDFPGGLANDVYHLELELPELGIRQEKHFFHILRRNEPAGPDKFGWHSCVNYLFGGYMDSVPVRIPVRYSHWSYVYAPFWLEDYGCNVEQQPEVDPECWNYEEVTEWSIQEGKKLILCIQTAPGQAWGQEYPLLRRTREGGGGMPKKELFQRWFRVLVERYRGRILAWEVENEPNAWFLPDHPEEYWKVCRMVYEVVKEVTPEVPVVGICGTSIFTPWMDRALAAGAGKYLDGVSWHSYLIENLPEETGLSDMLQDAVKKFPAGAPALNTETGCNAVMRYQIDRAIPPEEVKAKREARVFGFAFPSGFPGCSVDEWDASNKIVRNVVVNFCSGAKLFTFFGVTNGRDPHDAGGDWTKKLFDFNLFAVTPEGKRTPSLYMLAVAVCAAQLESATLDGIVPLADHYGINGGIFNKAEGRGKVAVLWAVKNQVATLLNADTPTLEQVDLHGRRSTLKATGREGDTYTYMLTLDAFPRYLHTTGKRLELGALPVEKLNVVPTSSTEGTLFLELGNRETRTRTIEVAPGGADSRVRFKPERAEVQLAPGAFQQLEFHYQLDPAVTGKSFGVPIRLKLDRQLEAQIEAEFKALKVVTLRPADNPVLALNRDEQVVIGHAPALASLAEADKYWNGPDELSGELRWGWDEQKLKLELTVRDQIGRPAAFPGIHGSSVELFFDFRTPERGLGNPNYGKNVYQFLLTPALSENEREIPLYSPQLANGESGGVRAWSQRLDGGYRLRLEVPWQLAGARRPESFGFDLGINGAFAQGKEVRRKTQLMLFGTAENARNAAAFGRIRLQP